MRNFQDCFSIIPEVSEVSSSWSLSFPTEPDLSSKFVSQRGWKLSVPEGRVFFYAKSEPWESGRAQRMGQDGRWERTQAKRGLQSSLLRELAPSSANSSWTSDQGGMQTSRPGSSKCGASTQRWDPLGLSPFPVLRKMKLRVQCSVPGNVHEGKKKKVCLYFRNPTLLSDGKFIHTVDVIKNSFFFFSNGVSLDRWTTLQGRSYDRL